MEKPGKKESNARTLRLWIAIIAAVLTLVFMGIFIVSKVIMPAYIASVMDNIEERYLEIRGLTQKMKAATSIPMELVRDFSLDGPNGPITLRLYVPPKLRSGAALVVYMHGGGFVIGDIAMVDAQVRRLARASGNACVSVNYALAPERPYPAALEDCTAVIDGLRAKPESLGFPWSGIVVAGDSAGATLAAVLCQIYRDEARPALAGQILFSPSSGPIDPLTGKIWPSRVSNARRGILTAKSLEAFGRMYLGDPAAQAKNPYVNPIQASSLADLPPALVISCGKDPLRDEARAYASRMADAGVRVLARDFPSKDHAYVGPEVIRLASDFLRGI